MADIATTFAAAGISHDMSAGTLTFNATDLERLLTLPGNAEIIPDASLLPALRLLRATPPEETWELTFGTDDDLLVTSSAGNTVVADEDALRMLIATGRPLRASPDTWEVMRRTVTLPIRTATVRLTADRTVRISSSLPHLVETAPVPVLLRVNATTFQMPVLAARPLVDLPGFRWEGERPPRKTAAYQQQTVTAEITEKLDVAGAAVIAGGRRENATATVTQLLSDEASLPALIACEASRLTEWHRTLTHRSLSVGSSGADVHVITYANLADGARTAAARTIIFDGFDRAATCQTTQAGLEALAYAAADYRVAVMSGNAATDSEAASLLRHLKPSEILAEHTGHLSYVGAPSSTPTTHFELFTVKGDMHLPAVSPGHCTVTDVPADMETHEAVCRALRNHEPLRTLSGLWLTGPSRWARRSPTEKAAALTRIAKANRTARRSTLFLVRSDSSARLVLRLVKGRPLTLTDAKQIDAAAATVDRPHVAVITDALPDLSGFAEVVIAEYPVPHSLLEHSDVNLHVVHASLPFGDSLDDQLAELSAAATRPLTEPEILNWLRHR